MIAKLMCLLFGHVWKYVFDAEEYVTQFGEAAWHCDRCGAKSVHPWKRGE